MNNLKIVDWSDFECDFPTPKWGKETMIQVVNLIKEELVKNNYVLSGTEHQNSLTGVPVFSDETRFRASMRCWGSICAEVYSVPNGETLSHMDFYIGGDCFSNLPDYVEFNFKPAVVEEESTGCTPKQDRQLIKQAITLNMPFLITNKVLQKKI